MSKSLKGFSLASCPGNTHTSLSSSCTRWMCSPAFILGSSVLVFQLPPYCREVGGSLPSHSLVPEYTSPT